MARQSPHLSDMEQRAPPQTHCPAPNLRAHGLRAPSATGLDPCIQRRRSITAETTANTSQRSKTVCESTCFSACSLGHKRTGMVKVHEHQAIPGDDLGCERTALNSDRSRTASGVKGYAFKHTGFGGGIRNVQLEDAFEAGKEYFEPVEVCPYSILSLLPKKRPQVQQLDPCHMPSQSQRPHPRARLHTFSGTRDPISHTYICAGNAHAW